MIDFYKIIGESGLYSSRIRYGTKGRASAIVKAAREYARSRGKPDVKVFRITFGPEDWEDVTDEFLKGDI